MIRRRGRAPRTLGLLLALAGGCRSGHGPADADAPPSATPVEALARVSPPPGE